MTETPRDNPDNNNSQPKLNPVEQIFHSVVNSAKEFVEYLRQNFLQEKAVIQRTTRKKSHTLRSTTE